MRKSVLGLGLPSLSLLLIAGVATPALAQHQNWRGGSPPAQQHGGPVLHGAPPQQAQPQHQAPQQRNYNPPQRSPEQARTWHQQGGWRQQGGGWDKHNNWQEHRAQNWQADHRDWRQRGGYGGYYIPADRFNLRFGDRHSFRLRTRPTIYNGYPRFRYGGYSFLIVDPWPESWGNDWYNSDDVYIDYDDGYYLYNRRYPGVGLAVTVMP